MSEITAVCKPRGKCYHKFQAHAVCMLLFVRLLLVPRTDSHPGSRDLEAKDQRGVTCLGRVGFLCPELKSERSAAAHELSRDLLFATSIGRRSAGYNWIYILGTEDGSSERVAHRRITCYLFLCRLCRGC